MALALGLIGAASVGLASYGQSQIRSGEARAAQRLMDEASMQRRPGRPRLVSELSATDPRFSRGELKYVGSFPYYGGETMSVYELPGTGQRYYQTSTGHGPGYGHDEAN